MGPFPERKRLASLDGDRSRTRGWFVLGLDVEPGYVAALATARPFRGLQHFIWSPRPTRSPRPREKFE
jgi:hypothetical protein